MPQDILITPNKGSSTTQGKIDFTGKALLRRRLP